MRRALFYAKAKRSFVWRHFATDASTVQTSQMFAHQCIKVTEDDDTICPISKWQCHMQPILHRAFSIFIFDEQRRLLIQKRAAEKITFPSAWSNTCCSHPLYNDSELDKAKGQMLAAIRRLNEEMGITSVTLSDMHMMGRFTYKYEAAGGWWEHEVDHVFVVPNFDGKHSPNVDEVAEAKWVSESELESMVADRDIKFTPWFRDFQKGNWLMKWWKNLDQLGNVKDHGHINPID